MKLLQSFWQDRNKKRVLTLILFLTLGLRIGVALKFGSGLNWYDEQNYHSIGMSIVSGDGFYSSFNPHSTTHWAPLQGYFLAGVYAILGDSPFMARIIQDLLAVLCCFLIYWTATRLFDHAVGVTAAVIFAFHPLFVYSANLLYALSNFTLLGVLVFVFLLKASESLKRSHAIGAGVFLGLAMLSKPVAIFFIPAVPLLFFLQKRMNLVQVSIQTALVLGVAGLTIAPWIYHNYDKYGEFYFITQEGAHSLAAANNAQFEMKGRGGIAVPDDIKSEVENLSEEQRNKVYMNEALGFILNNPVKFLGIYTQKFVTFWRLYPDTISKNEDTSQRNIIISAIFYGILLPVSLLGMIYSRKEWRRLFLLYGFIFGLAFGYSLFIPSIRYRMPIEPFLIIFAAYAIHSVVHRVLSSKPRWKEEYGI